MREDATDEQVKALGRDHANLSPPLSLVQFLDHFMLDVNDVIGGGYPAKVAYAMYLQARARKRIMPDLEVG